MTTPDEYASVRYLVDDVPDLDDMSHAELMALAEQRGVEVKKNDSKATIAAAIKAKH